MFIQSTEPVMETLQNVYTPFPLYLHIIFVAVAVAIFFVQFYRKGGVHYLLMTAATASTLITQLPGFSSSKLLIFILEIEEIVLCVGILFFAIFNAVKNKKKRNIAEKDKQDKGVDEYQQETFVYEPKYDEPKQNSEELKQIEEEMNRHTDNDKKADKKDDGDLNIYLN